MQAPTGLSFISHITINLYFFIKRRVSGRMGRSTPAANMTSSAAAMFSTAIIITVTSFNFYGLGISTYQSVRSAPDLKSTVMSMVSVAPASAAEKTQPDSAPQECSAVASSLTPIRLTDEKPQPDGTLAALSEDQPLWELTRQLILISLDGDLCKNEDENLCQTAMQSYLHQEAGNRLAAGGVVQSETIIKPGTIVTMDHAVAISLAPNK